MSVTVTLHLWVLGAYLGVGLVLWLPMEYVAYRRIARPRPPFWPEFRRLVRRSPFQPLLTVAAWPLALLEEVR